jgi:hypothetical protein
MRRYLVQKLLRKLLEIPGRHPMKGSVYGLAKEAEEK